MNISHTCIENPNQKYKGGKTIFLFIHANYTSFDTTFATPLKSFCYNHNLISTHTIFAVDGVSSVPSIALFPSFIPNFKKNVNNLS